MAAFLQGCLIAGLLLPLLAFALLALGGPLLRSRRWSLPGWLSVASIASTTLLAGLALFVWAGADLGERANWTRAASSDLFTWLTIGRFPVRAGILLDSLTLITFLMVAICSTCVQVFSIAYMRHDPRFRRYFALLSLFCFSMLGLVVSSNLLITFVFWELVGACSYFLIGFWFERPAAGRAATLAFLMNRVGDVGFLIGLAICATFLKTLSIPLAGELMQPGVEAVGFANPAGLSASGFLGVSFATWMGLALFCGAVGKSAQIPLHTWLPDAMEGPTPVSALIHAATMVAAGVYLLARIFPMLTPEARLVIALVGCVTLAVAALMALVQTDIKRVLAYSTMSQLGYMVFGIGVGAWVGSVHHLLTHAFFKALLFLGAGQAIAACAHQQDIRRLGGLAKKLPTTAIVVAIGVLAISGAGMPFTGLGIGGFYSKDEILTGAMAGASNLGGGLAWLLIAVPILVAYLTPLYMGRWFVLMFLGSPRDVHAHESAREQRLMIWPMLALAGLTLVSGWFLFRPLVAAAAPVVSGVNVAQSAATANQEFHARVSLLVGFAWVIGLGSSYVLYRDGGARLAALASSRPLSTLTDVLRERLFVDRLYRGVVVGLTMLTARIAQAVDEYVVDGVADGAARATARIGHATGLVVDARGVDGAATGVAAAARGLGGGLGGVQTGQARGYILLSAAGLAAMLLLVAAGGDWSWAAMLAISVAAVVAAPWQRIMARLSGPSGQVRGE